MMKNTEKRENSLKYMKKGGRSRPLKEGRGNIPAYLYTAIIQIIYSINYFLMRAPALPEAGPLI